MADLSKILGGPWSPTVEAAPLPIEVQFARAIEQAGLEVPESLVIDGRIHRSKVLRLEPDLNR